MNYQDFKQRIDAVQVLLGNISIPADRKLVGIMAQIHYLLDGMKDECDSCIHQEMMAVKEADAPIAE